ncbi:MAG: CRTAC1 family protein, partial [Acidimicrobiales bacterium]
GDPVTVTTHQLDRATIVLVGGRPSPQSLPVLGVAVTGTTTAVTWLRDRETDRAAPQPFSATFVLGQRDGRFVLAGDTSGDLLPTVETPTVPWTEVAEGLHFGTVVDEGSQPGQLPLFTDVTDDAGLRFDTGSLHGEDLPEPTPGYWDQASVFDLLNAAEAYYGSGQAWADVDGDGILDLFLTDQTGPNRLFLGTPEGTFVPAPAALADPPSLPGGGSGTASFVDVDNGGRPWLLVLTTTGPHLYRNDGGTAFVDVTATSGIDDDGKGFGAGWADYDGDGLLDLFLANYGCQPCSLQNRPPFGLGQGRLFHNLGGGRFEDATAALGDGQGIRSKAFLGTWTDYDDDGDADLLIVNDTRAFSKQPDRDAEHDDLPDGIAPGNVLLRNDGAGCDHWCFTDVTIEAGAGQRADFMGAAVGDFSGTGRPDVFLTNTGIIGSPTALLVNQGDGYRDLAGERNADLGEWTWGANALDVDNDGRLDVFTSVGFSDALLMRRIGTTRGDPSTSTERQAILDGRTDLPEEAIRAPFAVAEETERRTDNNRVLRQREDGSFEVVSVGASDLQPPPHYGNAVADYDDDGWPDVVSGSLGNGYALLHNRAETGPGNHRIGFDLRGDGRRVNRDAVGARVRVTDSNGTVRTAWVRLDTGSDRRLLVGLGTATAARAEIRWPDGTTTVIDAPQTDRLATVDLGQGTTTWTSFRAR